MGADYLYLASYYIIFLLGLLGFAVRFSQNIPQQNPNFPSGCSPIKISCRQPIDFAEKLLAVSCKLWTFHIFVNMTFSFCCTHVSRNFLNYVTYNILYIVLCNLPMCIGHAHTYIIVSVYFSHKRKVRTCQEACYKILPRNSKRLWKHKQF